MTDNTSTPLQTSKSDFFRLIYEPRGQKHLWMIKSNVRKTCYASIPVTWIIMLVFIADLYALQT